MLSFLQELATSLPGFGGPAQEQGYLQQMAPQQEPNFLQRLGGILQQADPEYLKAQAKQQETALMMQQYDLERQKFAQERAKAMRQQETQAKVAEAIKNGATPQQALQIAAQADPQSFLKEYASFKPDAEWETQVVDGALVRFNKKTGEAEKVYGDNSKKSIEGEGNLRKEFEGMQKEFRGIEAAKARIDASASNPSPAGDLSLIFNFMKILDPGSTVREGEFATAQNAGGIDETTRATFNRLINGERLTPEMRADFVDRSNKLFGAQAENFNKQAERYRGLATDYGLAPDRVAKTVDLPKSPALLTPEQKQARIQELLAKKAALQGVR